MLLKKFIYSNTLEYLINFMNIKMKAKNEIMKSLIFNIIVAMRVADITGLPVLWRI